MSVFPAHYEVLMLKKKEGGTNASPQLNVTVGIRYYWNLEEMNEAIMCGINEDK